ncbi:MAG: hypothetical protein H7839_23230 [Magnetococcus sp. YQC-5]
MAPPWIPFWCGELGRERHPHQDKECEPAWLHPLPGKVPFWLARMQTGTQKNIIKFYIIFNGLRGTGECALIGLLIE